MKRQKILLISYLGLGLIYSTLILLALFIPNFLLELGISYLPQIIYLNLGLLSLHLLVSICYFGTPKWSWWGKLLGQGRAWPKAWVGVNLYLTFVTSLAILSLQQFAYHLPLPTEIQASRGGEQSVKIASYNKLYTNRDYRAMEAVIKQENPDVLAIIELTKTDLDRLEILATYPYQLTNRPKIYGGQPVMDGLFSKFPFSTAQANAVEQLPSITAVIDPDPERQGDEFQAIVIHTAAPVTPTYFQDRSHQLANLKDYLNQTISSANSNQNQSRSTVPIVLMGDFNLTPFSPVYREFTDSLPLVNTANGQGLKYTWDISKYTKLPLTNLVITNHIDHIFVSPGLELEQGFKVGGKAGSDHSIVSVTIRPWATRIQLSWSVSV